MNHSVKAKTIILLEENIQVISCDLALGSGLLDVTLQHKQQNKK